MSEPLSRRIPFAAIIASALAAAPACQNRAHTDLYQQRMASEIRVLEDQLYEADYENRVLRDQLVQCKTSDAKLKSTSPTASTPEAVLSPPRVQRERDSSDDRDTDDDSEMDDDSFDDLELPMFDEGVPVDPDALTDPNGLDASDAESLLPPAPGGPEPPGKSDTTFPQVVPGELLPPPVTDDDEVKPPGQIQIPDSARVGSGIPHKLSIHTGLSGGHRIDGHIDGMMIVVNVLDRQGKTVDLESFDVDAELSVVILDPERESSEARIGRWDFPNAEVATLIRSDPISGLHVPVQWDEPPMGKEVVVHVRLQSEDDDMRCERRLNVEKQAAIAEWTPRGDAIR